jgi:hypothetical protein
MTRSNAAIFTTPEPRARTVERRRSFTLQWRDFSHKTDDAPKLMVPVTKFFRRNKTIRHFRVLNGAFA